MNIKERMPVRKYSGEMWRTNSSNKVRLVVDFDHKCAYCDDHDRYAGGYNAYHVEHFAPKEKFKSLEFTYENLLYSCPYCNISKSNKWVGDSSIISVIGNEGFVDPCTDKYYIHLERDSSGRITYTDDLGKYIYDEIKLYLNRHQLLFNLERIRVKKKLLQAKIDEKRRMNQDVTILEYFRKELCVVFCDYYELFTESDEE